MRRLPLVPTDLYMLLNRNDRGGGKRGIHRSYGSWFARSLRSAVIDVARVAHIPAVRNPAPPSTRQPPKQSALRASTPTSEKLPSPSGVTCQDAVWSGAVCTPEDDRDLGGLFF